MQRGSQPIGNGCPRASVQAIAAAFLALTSPKVETLGRHAAKATTEVGRGRQQEGWGEMSWKVAWEQSRARRSSESHEPRSSPSRDFLARLTLPLDVSGRMKERQQAVIHVLKVTEPDLKDIYTFYCHLGRLILRGGRPTMGMGQFMKFARHTGCVGSQDGVATENEGAATQAQVEVVFTQVANSEVQDTLQGDHRYYFEGFLECVIRLACLKYGFDPKCDAADARSKAAEAHKTAGGGAPGKAKAAKAQNVGKKRPGDGSAEQQQAELCSKGPGQTDLVTTLKVFLYNDVLPRARRNKLSGSAHARTKTGSMTGAAP